MLKAAALLFLMHRAKIQASVHSFPDFHLILMQVIRMHLEEIGINAGNWVVSAQDRDSWRALVNAALNLRVP